MASIPHCASDFVDDAFQYQMPAERELVDGSRALERYRGDDILVAVVGTADSRVSEFNLLLAGCESIPESAIHATRIEKHDTRQDRIVVLSTPYIDGTHKGDKEVLKKIKEWLAENYQNSVSLRALFYLRPAATPKKLLTGSPASNSEIYRHICGDPTMKRVQLVITDFDSQRAGHSMEPFDEFWEVFTSWGSKIHTLQAGENNLDSQDVWKIVNQLISDVEEDEFQQVAKDALELGMWLKNLGDSDVLAQFCKGLHLLCGMRINPRVAYSRTREHFAKFRQMIPRSREVLKIIVGQRLIEFVARTASQFLERGLRKCVYQYRRLLLNLPISPALVDFYKDKSADDFAETNGPARTVDRT